MPITGQFCLVSGHYRSSCGCVTVIRANRAQPYPLCPICMRATTWSETDEPTPAAKREGETSARATRG